MMVLTRSGDGDGDQQAIADLVAEGRVECILVWDQEASVPSPGDLSAKPVAASTTILHWSRSTILGEFCHRNQVASK